MQCRVLLSFLGLLCLAYTASAAGTPAFLATVPPITDDAVTYPEGSVSYTRRNYSLPEKGFFSKNWFVGIIIIIVVVAIVYVCIGTCVCVHFEYTKQKQAKQVVQDAYTSNGFFDLEQYVPTYTGRRDGRKESSDSMTFASARSRKTKQRSLLQGKNGSSSSSSSSSSSASSPQSDNDDNVVVCINPLRR